MSKEKIRAEAMALDPKDREALADELWRSVEHDSEQEIDAAWAREVEDRLAAYERGEIKTKPVDEVIDRLLNKAPRVTP